MKNKWTPATAKLLYAVCLVSLLLCPVGCATVPEYPVNSEFLGERVHTAVDSEIARYYLENYLQDIKVNTVFDQKIDLLYQNQGDSQLTREELKEIAAIFSVDFAAIFLADHLRSNKDNRHLQKTFSRFVEGEEDKIYSYQSQHAVYMILFVPGWDYAETGHITGADFAKPRLLVTDLGIENHLVEIPPNGSVEENANYLSKELIVRGQSGKKIIIVGASSAGPAIHLSLGEKLTKEQLQPVAAWVNIGGILQGSPLVDYYQQWPQRWLFNIGLWYKGWDQDNLMSMSAKSSRKRFRRLSLSDNVLVINYLGLSLSGQLSEYSKTRYPLLAPEGPNDGLTLLADVILPGSMTIIAIGSDHFFAEDPLIDVKTIALTKTVISYLQKPEMDTNFIKCP
jgi:hypothetical protein